MKSKKKSAPIRSRDIAAERVGGKISQHIRGLGTVTERMVQKRAEELALIAGRTRDQVTVSDLKQAKRELPRARRVRRRQPLGETAQPWTPVQPSPGRRFRNAKPQDDRNTEILVKEGVEEALHDEMLTEREER